MANDEEYGYHDYPFYYNQMPTESYNFEFPPICPCQYHMAQSFYMHPHHFEMNQRRYSPSEHHIMQQFLTEDGHVDIQKMLKTIGQFADTVQQVSPVIKQINDLIRSFRT